MTDREVLKSAEKWKDEKYLEQFVFVRRKQEKVLWYLMRVKTKVDVEDPI